MDKLLNFIQQLLPLVTFYPRWAQLLFLATFAMFLVSLLVFVVLFSAASDQMMKSESAKHLPQEVRQEIDKDLNSISTLVADLGLSLSNYYASAISLRLALLDYTTANPDIQSYMADPLTELLKRNLEETIEKIESVRSALSRIQRDEFAAACWRRTTEGSGVQALMQVRENLLRLGFSETESTIDIADLPNLTQFFSVAVNKLRGFSFTPLLATVLATNSADIEGVGMSYDHAALRSLVFSGNLIFSFVAPAKNDEQQHFVASWGTAMLLDIFKSMPTSDTVRGELLARYPMYPEPIAAIPISLDPDALVGSDFRIAVAELEERRGLLFLELPR